MKGAGFALISAALFGASTPLAKMVVGNLGPLMVAGLFYLGAGVGLAACRMFASQAAVEAKLSRADMPWLVGAIVVGGMLAPALLMVGLAKTSAGTASLLLTLEGVATAFIALIVFREHIGWRNAGGFALIVLGSAMLAWRGDVATPTLLGPALIICACVAWGIDNNLTRQISSADPLAIAMWKGLVAGPVNIVLALVAGEGRRRHGPRSWRWCLAWRELVQVSCCSFWRCGNSAQPGQAPTSALRRLSARRSPCRFSTNR